MAKKLVRQALGCDVALGDFYNAHTDCISDESYFESTLPTVIQMHEDNAFDFCHINSCDITDILSMLGVEGEQQLSIISGLCDSEGLGSYLIGEAQATTCRKATAGILVTMKTQTEKICINDELRESFSNSVPKNGHEPHVVEEVTYGVQTFVFLESKDSGTSLKDINDNLKKMMNIVEASFNGQPFPDQQIVETRFNQMFKICIFPDHLSSSGMQVDSFQQALDYVKNIPNLVTEVNSGKGVPLSFIISPISEICKNYVGGKQLMMIPDEVIIPIKKCFNDIIKIRQKVCETYNVLNKHEFCVREEDINSISTAKTRSKTNLKKFQEDLVEVLKKVRSGTMPPSALQLLALKTEERPYSAKKVELILQGLNSTIKKLKLIETLLAKGVRYVGKEDSLKEVIEDIKVEDVYVLHYSTRALKNRKAEWRAAKKAFLGYANDPNKVCVLSDDDFINDAKQRDGILISHYSNGQIVDSDDSEDEDGEVGKDITDHEEFNELVCASMVKDECASKDDQVKNHLVEDSDVSEEAKGYSDELCYAESLEVKPTVSNPRKKAYLRLQCPGATSPSVANSPCCGGIKTWHCQKCLETVFYGFDERFYCTCGSASCYSYRFLCSDEVHGEGFMKAPSSKSGGATKFIRLLNNLEPLKELNILIMGETGVGKSTWINSFVNYLTFETMEEAEKLGPKYLIGSSFVMTDEDYQPIEINMGPAENDNNTKGQSVTQMPSSYIFTAGELLVRLVDTPGVGDTRGIDQDKINFQNVLSHLSHLEELHGICILLKSNSARLTITFQFCIKELLTHLHKDACKNIVFVFTNARETFYRPGDTFATLRNLLRENKDIVIPLGKETLFCMDNESMRFLAAINQGMVFNTEDRENYSNSWRKAVAENERLVQHILALRAHFTRQTISLNEARRLILGLTEPLAHISQNIQNNIMLAQNRSDEINDMVARSDDLKGKLNIPVMDIIAKELPYPRTVCTSINCVESRVVEGVTKVHYKTWCHEHCYLNNVQVQTYPCPELRGCTAMGGTLNCKVCTCSWDVHMHLTYESIEVTKQTTDKNVEELLEREDDAIKAVEKFLVEVNQRITNLKEEQATINRVASKCGTFLKQNAITPYNDSVDEYMQQCIRIQKDLVYAGASDKTLKGLERMLANYRQEVNILEMSMKDDATGNRINPDDIPKLIEDLYALPINGKSLKSFVDVAMSAQQNMVAYQEKFYTTPYKKKESFLKRAWNKIKGN